MKKTRFIAIAACAAVAAPSAAMATPAVQGGTAVVQAQQEASVEVEQTDKPASNYVSKENEFIFENVKITGEQEGYVYTVTVPECYSLHGLTAYIEHSNGDTERIIRSVPQEPGDSDIDFKLDIDGSATLTVAIELYNAVPNVPNPNFNPNDVKTLYSEFASSAKATSYTASNGYIAATLVETGSDSERVQGISAVNTLDDTGRFAEYANGYWKPEDGGVTLGSFRYYISPGEQGEESPATKGFEFSVDKQYAGWTARVFMDIDEHFYVGQASVAEVEISDDGTFIVPYGMVDTEGNEQGEIGLCLKSLNRYLDRPTTGVITVVAEPSKADENGVVINYGTLSKTAVSDSGTVFSIASSEVSANIYQLTGDVSYPGGYEEPEQGGKQAGFFYVSLYPFGEAGDEGRMYFKFNVGSQYAGRKASIYSSSGEGEQRKWTFTIGQDGTVTLPATVCVEYESNSCQLRPADFAYGINIEPAATVSISDATVSAIPAQTWTGTPVTPKPTVKLDDKTLVEGTDYELSYEDNDAPGTATVIITGIGGYTGTVRVEFTIKDGTTEGPDSPQGPGSAEEPGDTEEPDDTETAFSDVSEGLWYYDAVMRAAELGIMNGYSGTDRFGPLDTLTREQAAAVLFNYLGEGDHAAPPAPHVDVKNDWYTDAVNWAVSKKIMTGYAGTNLFGVGKSLTREEFCAVVANAVGADLAKADTSLLDKFPDGDRVSEWARPAVAWAVESGVLNGVEREDGTRELQSTRGLNRAEMAAMTVNAIDAKVLAK